MSSSPVVGDELSDVPKRKGAPSRRLCLVQRKVAGPTETFIRSHGERMPATTTVVHGVKSPRIGDQQVLPDTIWNRVRSALYGRIHSIPWDKRRSTLAWIDAFRRMRAEAVLAEYGDTAVRCAPACRIVGIPFIAHFHGCDATHYQVLQRYKNDYRKMFQQAAAVVAVSRAMEIQLQSLGAPVERLHYNPYGVDLKRFRLGRPDENPPVFLSVGRFVEKKAPYLTIVAFADVLSEFPDARLRMVGDGLLLPMCRDLVQGLGIEHAVAFLGSQPHDVVAEEMAGARCFVQHSVQASDGDCEGTPVAILEAAAAGLPIVSTRHAGIVDVVNEGETGLLVDERDAKNMAKHMKRMVAAPGDAAGLGQAGRRRIEAHFSMERSIANLWSIIEGCL